MTMKRLLKRPLRAVWRWTWPLRRPLVGRYEALTARAVAAATKPPVCHVTAETSLLMDHVLRELFRLQAQVDQLQSAVEALTPSGSGLAVVGGLDADAHSAAG